MILHDYFDDYYDYFPLWKITHIQTSTTQETTKIMREMWKEIIVETSKAAEHMTELFSQNIHHLQD